METRGRILLLFDVDGTLTPHRKSIPPPVQSFLLDEVLPRVSVGLVSGSDRAKLAEQMNGDQVLDSVDFVFSENGLVAHERGGKLLGKQSIAEFVGEANIQKVINFALRYMSDMELPAKRGNFVEFRAGLVNLCPVGRSCTQAHRDDFAKMDKELGLRKKFQKALQSEFPDSGLQFAIGGQISIDVFPVGWDKRFCLRYVEDQAFQEIHFFGDRTEEGGNDHEIFEDPRTIGHAVTSPEDTVRQVKQVLNMD